jgi:hypothetical protein
MTQIALQPGARVPSIVSVRTCREGATVPSMGAEPDVWWGSHGIDALLWPKPYTRSDARDTVEPTEAAQSVKEPER